MVNVTEVSGKSNKKPKNPNPNQIKAVVVRRRKNGVVNGDFDDDDENNEFQAAHKFKNGQLIMTLVAWIKKPSVEHDLSGVLAKFHERCNGTPDFIEAALILQAAANLYGKKVDLLFKSIMASQLRIVKSFNIINAEELQKIEKKMRKRKLTRIEDLQPKSKRRKKRYRSELHPFFEQLFDDIWRIFQDNPFGRIKIIPIAELFQIGSESLQAMTDTLTEVTKWKDPEFLKAEDEKYRKAYEARFIPMEEYIYRPHLEESQLIAYENPDKEQKIPWKKFLMSHHDFYHDKKFKWYEVFYNKKDPKTMMDVTVWENAVFNHRKANLDAEDYCDLLNNYNKFNDTACEKFLMDSLKEEYEAQKAAETALDKIKRLCPYKLDVHVNRLADDVLQRYLNNEPSNVAEEEEEEEEEEEATEQQQQVEDNVAVLIISNPNDSNSEEQLLILPQTSEESTNATEVSVASLESNNDSGFNSAHETSLENLTPNEDVASNETIVEEIGLAALMAQEKQCVVIDMPQNKTPLKLRERKPKEPKVSSTQDDDDFDETEKEKRQKKKKPAKLEPITTCNFLDYERFFCSNYTTEEREGIVVALPPLEEPLPQLEEVAEDNNLDVDESSEEVEQEVQSHIPKIPRLPTGEIITPELRRFMEIEAQISERRDDRRWFYDWEILIQARLKEHQVSKFDIHEYGTNIVNQFPADQPDKTIMFKDMVKDKPRKEVIRNFMAALHLANSMNLEPSGTNPGELCNDTLQFKLLKRELHHETLMDYEAPSELNLKAKRKKQKRQADLTSTPKSSQAKQLGTNCFVLLNQLNLPQEENSSPNIASNQKAVSKSFEVRCTTTIVKTPCARNFNTPIATSTPSPRSNHLMSWDSGIYTDGGSTPDYGSPLSKVRRLTVEELDVFEATPGPSTDYSVNYPAAFDDTLSVDGDTFNTPIYRQQGKININHNNRKRQLDFGKVTEDNILEKNILLG